MGFVAGIIKTLPQRVVGCAALVRSFPLVAHHAQAVLLLATTEWLGNQRFSLDDQRFADLVGTPALPAFKLARGRECGVGSGFQLAVDVAYIFFQGLTQISGNFGCGLAVAFTHFMFQFGKRRLHDGA